MSSTTLLIGSLGAICDRDELLRASYNRAFDEHGLSWSWCADTMQSLSWLTSPRARIVAYAESRGMGVHADRIVASQQDAFEALVAQHGLTLRDGILDLVDTACGMGLRLGLASTSSRRHVAAVRAALKNKLPFDRFDFVGDGEVVNRRKPAPDVYLMAAEVMGFHPVEAVVIETSASGARAAINGGFCTYVWAGARRGPVPEGARLIRDPMLALAGLGAVTERRVTSR